MMALALNNIQKVDMPLNQTNQIKPLNKPPDNWQEVIQNNVE